MKKREIVKRVFGSVTSAGVGIIIGNVVRATTPPTISLLGKGLILVGGTAMSGVAGDCCSRWLEEQIDDIFGEEQKLEVVEDKPE